MPSRADRADGWSRADRMTIMEGRMEGRMGGRNDGRQGELPAPEAVGRPWDAERGLAIGAPPAGRCQQNLPGGTEGVIPGSASWPAGEPKIMISWFCIN